MPYLIDGHNLIAALPDISLEDPDDEARLLERLRTFSARSRKPVTVYFDRGLPGPQGPNRTGGVRAIFVTPPRSADDAIRAHLLRLRNQARNWTVVSSDGEVRAAARRAGARSLSAGEFASLLSPLEAPSEEVEKPPAPSTAEEISRWEALFGSQAEED